MEKKECAKINTHNGYCLRQRNILEIFVFQLQSNLVYKLVPTYWEGASYIIGFNMLLKYIYS
uniref:Uncharacterized protein n=1 Tax=Ciona intestinalis TaxID=7719 RepID=H2XS43_CIOIN